MNNLELAQILIRNDYATDSKGVYFVNWENRSTEERNKWLTFAQLLLDEYDLLKKLPKKNRIEEKTSMERIGALFFELDREIKKIEEDHGLATKVNDLLQMRILRGNDLFVQSLMQKDKEFDEKERRKESIFSSNQKPQTKLDDKSQI